MMMRMMKIPQSCLPILRRSPFGISRVFRVLFYSTGTVTSSSSSKDTLYRRLTPFGRPTLGFWPQEVLDQWVAEGRPVEREELMVTIKQLRKFKRFRLALEVSEWMSDKRYIDLLPGDIAVRLDLIAKVRGLEKAEEYFNNIHTKLMGGHVYGALLNCFAREKNVEKSESIMQKMNELGFAKTALTYNVMLKLYSDVGNHEKLDSLLQEMEKKGISCDTFTYNTRLNAYACASDLDGMEKFLMKMEAFSIATVDWHSYVIAANGYLKAGAVEKASSMLKKSEELVTGKERRHAQEVILSLYASIGNKEDVHRIWQLSKTSGKIYNRSYHNMISSLAKLDDLDGAEKIWEEWEAVKEYSDSRVPYAIISAYCQKGFLGKAESIANRLMETEVGHQSAGIWQCLAAGYHENDQGEKALEAMKKAIVVSHPGWKAKLATVVASLEYLKRKGSMEAAEDFAELLKEKGCIPTELCDKFVKEMRNAKLEPEAQDHMGGDRQALEGEQSAKELNCEIIS